jgi:ornithine cyclodeaminase/alanine dehydrogenase-like protein (mu-crystallin family)
MQAQKLIDTIKDVFFHQQNYAMHKYVYEFEMGGKFVGDFYNYFIYEKNGETAPFVYHTASPYDVISKKAPDQALVFHDGKVVFNTDFTHLVAMRTGVMDALVLQNVGITSLGDKRVILFGTGNVARWSLQYLKEIFPDLMEIDVVNASGNAEDFITFAKDVGVTAHSIKDFDIAQYDVIILHTSATQPVLNKDHIEKIKKGAVILSYRTTSPVGEVESEFFNTQKANVIVDWDASVTSLPEMKEATEKGWLAASDIISLEKLLAGNIPSEKSYTIFRSSGTPMQNVGILKLAMHETART